MAPNTGIDQDTEERQERPHMREWTLGIALSLFTIVGMSTNTLAQSPRYDLLLKGGHVIDPANNVDAVMDVAVVKDKIAAVEKDIPASQAGKVVDATGLYVTPGLVDIHVHIGHGGAPLDWFTPEGRSHLTPYGIPADIALQSGVTTMVDAGSSGADTFLLEKEEVIDRAKVRVLAFLNIVANGMQGDLEQSVDQMDVKRCAETIKKYPDIIVGVKTAHYWTEEPWDGEHTPWAAVDKAEECGRAVNLPVMFDFWPRPDRSYAELILKKMRPGDIHTHVFAQQFPILLADGKLNPILAEARARGVIFDVGHGAGSFWFRNAVPAVKQGFIPGFHFYRSAYRKLHRAQHDPGDVQISGHGSAAARPDPALDGQSGTGDPSPRVGHAIGREGSGHCGAGTTQRSFQLH